MANSLQAQIPVIDISHDNVEAPRQLLDAATKFGFIYIANDKGAIDPGLIAAMFALSREFFASPVDVKESVSIRSNQAGKNHGWLSQGVEKLDPAGQKRPDVKEAFNMAEPIHHRPQQPLTPLLTARLPLLLDFHAACRALCSAVLEHLATALGIPADWFASRHDPDGGPSGSVLRMLYYPGARGTPAGGDTDDDDEARGDIRAGAHSDFGSITCLFQLPGQPGLEILTPEGEWAAVAVDPDPLAPSASSESPSSDLSAAAAPSPSSTTATTAAATAPRGRRNLPILVNIGDLLEEWTGGLLKSTRHRVVFPQVPSPPPSSNPGEASGSSSDRYSLAYFCHPLDDAALEPVPSRLVQEHIASSSSSRTEAAAAAETATTTTAERAVITAKDHLARRLAETYTIPTASP